MTYVVFFGKVAFYDSGNQMMVLLFRFFFLLILFPWLKLYSVSPPYAGGDGKKSTLPWFTGPLLTTSSRVVPPGHADLEPYLYWTVFNGKYGKDWKVTPIPEFYELTAQFVYKIGLVKGINIGGSIQGFYNWTQGEHNYAFGDLPIGFDFQLFKGKEWFLKFTIQETFPTGKYQKLNPRKLKTDQGGAGSYVSQIGFTVGHLYHFSGPHYLSSRCNVAVNIPSRVHVSGANTYGGGPGTHGRVFPGINFSIFYGAEYSLTNNWALAIDVVGLFTAKTSFRGQTLLPVGGPSAISLSAAPAIEYNWNETMGLIVGAWFSFAGRNTDRFVNAVAAFNYNY